MRWIFWFLLIINVVVFSVAWLQQRIGSEGDVVAPVAAPSFGEDVESLVLLPSVSQAQGGGKKEAVAVSTGGEVDPETEVGMGGAEAMCTLVGPFADLLQAEYLVENTQALGVKGEIQSVQVPGDMTYWVLLPPEISRKAALRRLHELQAKGLDSYVIPKGELENGISFGMFSRKSLADNLLASLQAQGYPVQLKEVAKMHSQTWVMFSAHDAGLLDNKTWLNLLKGAPDVERRQNFCSTVAPE